MKKIFSLCFLFAFFALSLAPAYAQTQADVDKDGYWNCGGDDVSTCGTAPLGSNGWEPKVCDQVTIPNTATLSIESNTYPLMSPDINGIAGNKVHPKAIEQPNSKIDMNCDGKVSGWVPEEHAGEDADIFGIIGDIIKLIGQIAVFVSAGALIYGGIMFATASGEEMKIQKAKRTIFGAVIGLIVGLLAWNIVGFVTNWVG